MSRTAVESREATKASADSTPAVRVAANDGLLRTDGRGRAAPARRAQSQGWTAGRPTIPLRRTGRRISRVDRMVMVTGIGEQGAAARLPALSPDGAATSEVYLVPGSLFADEMAAVSRRRRRTDREPDALDRHRADGSRESATPAECVCGGEPGPVWVVGRSAGPRTTSTSLSSGVRAARDIARSLASWLRLTSLEVPTSAGKDAARERGSGRKTSGFEARHVVVRRGRGGRGARGL